MQRIVFAVLIVMMLVGGADAQPKLTPEQQKLLDKQKDDAAAAKLNEGELSVAGLKVGAKGFPTHIDAKVMQVVDEKSMLVGIEDSRNGNGKYTTWVMVKAPTTGIVDGEFWRGAQWKEMTGIDVLVVTGTTTYKATGGGTKTVFVLEGEKAKAADGLRVKPAVQVISAIWGVGKKQADVTERVAELLAKGKTVVVDGPVLGPDPAPNVMKSLKLKLKIGEQVLDLTIPDRGEFTLTSPKPAKTGAAAYDSYPKEERAQLVKDWEEEREALKRAIKDDEERLASATTAKDKQHFERLITEYKAKLTRHEVNDPPYITKK